MEVSGEAIRKNFQGKTDTELLDLVNSGDEMTSEARFLLLKELQSRLETAKRTAETVPLVHGWYTVVAPTAGIKFPEFCPRCSRFADSSCRFQSLEHRGFRLFYWKRTRAVSNVPHCSGCVAEAISHRLLVDLVPRGFFVDRCRRLASNSKADNLRRAIHYFRSFRVPL